MHIFLHNKLCIFGCFCLLGNQSSTLYGEHETTQGKSKNVHENKTYLEKYLLQISLSVHHEPNALIQRSPRIGIAVSVLCSAPEVVAHSLRETRSQCETVLADFLLDFIAAVRDI